MPGLGTPPLWISELLPLLVEVVIHDSSNTGRVPVSSFLPKPLIRIEITELIGQQSVLSEATFYTQQGYN